MTEREAVRARTDRVVDTGPDVHTYNGEVRDGFVYVGIPREDVWVVRAWCEGRDVAPPLAVIVDAFYDAAAPGSRREDPAAVVRIWEHVTGQNRIDKLVVWDDDSSDPGRIELSDD